jgi:hypothetical protein
MRSGENPERRGFCGTQAVKQMCQIAIVQKTKGGWPPTGIGSLSFAERFNRWLIIRFSTDEFRTGGWDICAGCAPSGFQSRSSRTSVSQLIAISSSIHSVTPATSGTPEPFGLFCENGTGFKL